MPALHGAQEAWPCASGEGFASDGGSDESDTSIEILREREAAGPRPKSACPRSAALGWQIRDADKIAPLPRVVFSPEPVPPEMDPRRPPIEVGSWQSDCVLRGLQGCAARQAAWDGGLASCECDVRESDGPRPRLPNAKPSSGLVCSCSGLGLVRPCRCRRCESGSCESESRENWRPNVPKSGDVLKDSSVAASAGCKAGVAWRVMIRQAWRLCCYAHAKMCTKGLLHRRRRG